MNSLPCILSTEDKNVDSSDRESKRDGDGKCYADNKDIDKTETCSEKPEKSCEEENINDENINLPQRPTFLPPLISKPNTCKIWSISNIIGNSNESEKNSDNERESE